MRFDHAIIAVTSLESANAAFEAMGFNVVTGGVHSGGLTHNSLVAFSDGSYLELMAPTDLQLLDDPPEPGPGNYLFLFDQGEGIVGLAFETDDIDAEVARVRARGLSMGEPQQGGRRREDGVELAWKTAFLTDAHSPFLLMDLTARNLRVRGDPEAITHPNGAKSVVGIRQRVERLDDSVRRFETFFGAQSVSDSSDVGGSIAAFELGRFRLLLEESSDAPTAQRERANQIEIESEDVLERRQYDAHRARIVLLPGDSA